MPQNEYMELHKKRYGQRFDHEERKRKVRDTPPPLVGRSRDLAAIPAPATP